MRIYQGIEEQMELGRPVVAVGSFDGVHLGHRQVLSFLVRTAKERETQSVVVTFNPHPQMVLRSESDFFSINSVEENIRRIALEGVDAVGVIPFTKAFSELSYVEFVEHYLINRLHVRTIVMGPNHAVGHNREGNHLLLSALCTQHQVEVIELPELLSHQVGVHSSLIRKAIQSGNRALAETLLGYPYEKMQG